MNSDSKERDLKRNPFFKLVIVILILSGVTSIVISLKLFSLDDKLKAETPDGALGYGIVVLLFWPSWPQYTVFTAMHHIPIL